MTHQTLKDRVHNYDLSATTYYTMPNLRSVYRDDSIFKSNRERARAQIDSMMATDHGDNKNLIY